MSLLRNAIIWTERSVQQLNGLVSAPQPNLPSIPCHIAPDRNKQYTVNSESNVIEQFYTAKVNSGTDIGIGDVISKITKLDGVTPWPGDVSTDPSNPRTPDVTWTVWNENEEAPGRLAQRTLFLKRTFGGGPMTL